MQMRHILSPESRGPEVLGWFSGCRRGQTQQLKLLLRRKVSIIGPLKNELGRRSLNFFWVLGIEPKALCTLGMCSTRELHPSSGPLNFCQIYFPFSDMKLSCQ